VVRWYVNRAIDRSVVYEGRIGDVDLHLWRGAYTIRDIQLNKTTGNVPVPLFSAPRVDLAVQWDAVFHGRMVGQITMDQPELNFVDADNSAESQTGDGGPWLQIIEDLFPFKINRAAVRDGAIHFRTFTRRRPVDVYIDHLDAAVDDLTNIRDDLTPLVTTVTAKGLAMDQAKFEYRMKLDPFSYRPTFHMAVRLLGLDVTKINELALAYGKFDFKRGWFDLIVEVESKEGRATGYVKPLFRNLRVFSLARDVKEDNALRFFWQGLVGLTTQILKNHPRDQFGTLIPFRGDLTAPGTDVLAAIGNILRNAFVRAYLPRLQGGTLDVGGMEFDPPSIEDPVSVGDRP
jgi:hypothetical protein